MANRIKISFASQPSAFSTMSFAVSNSALGYTYVITKQFITGTSTVPNHIKIGVNLAETMSNILANLNANNIDGNSSYELGSLGVFYVNFLIVGVYNYNIISDPGDTSAVFETEDIVVPTPFTLPPLDLKHISIRIFDTYTNSRILIEELAQANACKIDWDGGDDLYKSIMASKLVFNMLVPAADDAHFIHLFSGDEQRFRVELIAINVDDDEQLIWQGFLLPDQYNEPYINVSFFVDFTATDMLSSMKGKYLEPWYYQNTIPIAQVFAYCFATTGLEQNIIVNPSVVPSGALYTWQSINVDMRSFIDNDKLKDCYSIIDDLLQSQGLTLNSYRGYWWLQGVSRKGEINFTSYQFDINGNRVEDIVNSKISVDYMLQANAPNLIAITPWKRVNIDFKKNGSKNLFSDWIVKIPKSEQFYSLYVALGYSLPISTSVFFLSAVKMKKWIDNISSEFFVRDWFNQFSPGVYNEYFSVLYWVKIFVSGSSYNYTEAMALNRWLESPETPFVKPGNLYEFEFEFTVDAVVFNFSEDEFIQNLENGSYDKLVPFQIFINGIEKYSNRPSFSSDANLRYTASYSNLKITFKLKFNFRADVEGFLKVRFLVPIHQKSLGGIYDFTFMRVICEKLSLSLVDDYDENTDTIALREINYTQELDFKIPITCTVDNSVINSFGIGSPISNNYFKIINRTVNDADFVGHHYFLPNVDLNLTYKTFDVSTALIKTLFEYQKLKSVFLEKTNGKKTLFSDLWFSKEGTYIKLAYLKSYEGFPVIPKKYKAYPDVVSDDVLKYMHVEYGQENYANRLNWKLFGSSEVQSYPKALATALHGVQYEMLYRMEATALALIFPDNLIGFYFDNADRNFIPTKLSLDLFNGKTSFVATEAKFNELTDIIYE